MQFYLINATILVISAGIVSALAFRLYRPKGNARNILVFVISLSGAALGLVLYSMFPLDLNSRLMRFIFQFAITLLMSGLMVFLFFFIRSRPDPD